MIEKCRVCGIMLGPDDPVFWFRIWSFVFMPVHKRECQEKAARAARG